MNWHFWLELLVRSSVLLIAGEVLLRLSKRQRASFRHGLAFSAFALLAMLPVFSLAIPDIYIPLGRPTHAATALVTAQTISSRPLHATIAHPFNWLPWVWLAGAAFAAAPLIVGAIAARRMAKRAASPGPALQTAVEKLAPEVEVLLSSEVEVPLACGLLRRRILLPASAEHWTVMRLEAVLAHELAHVRRRDVAAQVAAHMVAALWWFQPLVWVMRQRLRVESEFACDAEALRLGFRPSDYAMELLAVARAMGREDKTPSLAISMVRSCELEDRVRAILNPTAALLGPLRAVALAAVLGSLAVGASAVSVGSQQSFDERGGSIMKRTILAALLTSAGLSAATVTGAVADTSGAALSDVNVVLSNPDTGAKQEAATGADGKFSLEGNGPGQYILRLEKPGFVSIFRVFDMKADTKTDREFTMAPEGGESVADKVVNTTEQKQKVIRVGGEVEESNLTTKVQPVYPAAAKAARVQGSVHIEATISKDGVPIELRVLSSPSDDLSQSAVEAVRQWRYRPTLLNGAPIEVVTEVLINYTLSR
ncbi:MAG: TonB family protein [Acidobacteriaceae bacterium]|nr:TonB family protein [Acidobacteriaceae bacterium]